MADIVLKDKNGNPVTHEVVKQMQVPNSEGGKTLYTNLENMKYYYAESVGEGLYKVRGSFFSGNGKDYLLGLGGLDTTDDTNIYAIFTTASLHSGHTYKLASGAAIREVTE